jgi:hypothetical protein
MSRTEEDILSRVDITIMRDTALSTYPASYSEVCDTFRPRGSEFVGQLPQMPRILDLLPIRQGSEVFQAQVDADAAAHRSRFSCSHLHDDIQEPMAARIAGEVRAVLDLAGRQRPGAKHPEGVSGKAEGFPLALQIAALQRHPAQRAAASPTQERTVPLTAGLGVLFAHRIDGARVQAEFLASSSRQPIQIESARPSFVPLQGLLLSVVAEIPDKIAGSGLTIKQSVQGFDAVSIHQQHRRKLIPSKTSHKALKLTETSIFRSANPRPRRGTSSRAQVPESPCRKRDEI